jgi:hypothetical protein
MNSQVADTFNFYLMENATDPDDHLIWLRNELKYAENNL